MPLLQNAVRMPFLYTYNMQHLYEGCYSEATIADNILCHCLKISHAIWCKVRYAIGANDAMLLTQWDNIPLRQVHNVYDMAVHGVRTHVSV